ncbi:hypothetical protein [Solimicrobium silvestre]|nr:hypothetical protein [Solimicrobium silvestre]
MLNPIDDLRFYFLGLLVSPKIFVEIYQGLLRSIKGAQENLPFLRVLVQFFPPALVSSFRFHYSLCYGFLCWLSRKKYEPDLPDGASIPFMNKSDYQTAFIMLLLMLLVEVPISSFAFGFSIKDPIERHWAHVLMITISIYTLILVLGDRWKLKNQHHQLDRNFLYLRCADRFFADIPVEQIKNIAIFKEELEKWKLAKRKLNFSFEIVSPCSLVDKPNLIIELVESSTLHVKRKSLKMSAPKYILLFVDEPSQTQSLIANSLTHHVEV